MYYFCFTYEGKMCSGEISQAFLLLGVTFVTVSWATDILSFVTVSLPISSLGGKCDSLVALAEQKRNPCNH